MTCEANGSKDGVGKRDSGEGKSSKGMLHVPLHWKTGYLLGNPWFPVDVPLNQSIDDCIFSTVRD